MSLRRTLAGFAMAAAAVTGVAHAETYTDQNVTTCSAPVPGYQPGFVLQHNEDGTCYNMGPAALAPQPLPPPVVEVMPPPPPPVVVGAPGVVLQVGPPAVVLGPAVVIERGPHWRPEHREYRDCNHYRC